MWAAYLRSVVGLGLTVYFDDHQYSTLCFFSVDFAKLSLQPLLLRVAPKRALLCLLTALKSRVVARSFCARQRPIPTRPSNFQCRSITILMTPLLIRDASPRTVNQPAYSAKDSRPPFRPWSPKPAPPSAQNVTETTPPSKYTSPDKNIAGWTTPHLSIREATATYSG